MSYIADNNIIQNEATQSNFDHLGGLGNTFFNCLKKHSKNRAQIDPNTGRTDTYGDILKRSVRTAIALRERGVGKGDKVIICAGNSLDGCVPIIACYFLGSIPCPLDASLTPLETTTLLDKVKCKIIFTVPEALENILKALEELNLNIEIVTLGSSKSQTEFDTFLQQQKGEDDFEPYFSTDLKETATIYFSSGTTGLRKACCLSHNYFIASSSLALAGRKIKNIDEERKQFEMSIFKTFFSATFLSYSQWSWISTGKLLFEIALSGGCRILCHSFDVKEFWDIVDKYKVGFVGLSPYIITELVKYGKPDNISAATLMKIFISGSTLSKSHNNALRKLLPFTDIINTYGLTETGGITYFEIYNKVHREYIKNHLDSVGFPYPGVSYKVVDTETNENLGPHQKGELRVKSSFMMNGYYNEDCQDMYDEDGWYKTGDIVYYDEYGGLYIIDRIKELIKFRSLNVYPYILELELLKHPAVKQAVVIGKLNEIDGHHPMAIVVLDENFKDATAEDIQKFVDERVQDKYKVRGGVKFIDSLPLNSNGKVKREELKKMFKDI